MVREISGDVITAAGDSGIICHQVNYFGVMGAGVAASIREKLLTAVQYGKYVSYCDELGTSALGTVQFLPAQTGACVANMFCQGDQPDRTGSLTLYDAMRTCFVRVEHGAGFTGRSVFIPARIGCGIAGGDWERVKSIIRSVFDNSPVEAVIVNWVKQDA